MTNEERRAALATARRYALDHAQMAEAAVRDLARADHAKLAEMWAHVADALKDGDPAHDSVTDEICTPPSSWDHWDGTTVR